MHALSPLTWPFVSIGPVALAQPRLGKRRCDLVGAWPGGPRLAVVGSRAAHRHVLAALSPLLELAMRRGWTLVSGGALGIDGAAHRAALELGMPQLAVLPCGRDRLYPRNHAALFDAMRRCGHAGLLFANAPGTRAVRPLFASRNAIIVNLADAVLVAEAGLRSGSRGTGELSLQRKRPTAVFAGSPGCGVLIGRGAHPLPAPPRAPRASLEPLCAAFGSWLDELAGRDDASASAASAAWPAELDHLRELIIQAGPSGASLESLGQRHVLALLEAELLGLIVEAGPGRWVCLG